MCDARISIVSHRVLLSSVHRFRMYVKISPNLSYFFEEFHFFSKFVGQFFLISLNRSSSFFEPETKCHQSNFFENEIFRTFFTGYLNFLVLMLCLQRLSWNWTLKMIFYGYVDFCLQKSYFSQQFTLHLCLFSQIDESSYLCLSQ